MPAWTMRILKPQLEIDAHTANIDVIIYYRKLVTVFELCAHRR